MENVEKIDRKKVYDILDDIIRWESPEEQVAILKDIIVDGFVDDQFLDTSVRDLADLEANVSTRIQANPSQKITIIKEVREATGLGLAEAKHFVESLTPGHPSYGQSRDYAVAVTKPQPSSLPAKLKSLASRYGTNRQTL